jgi:TRAP transporter TAXI family solute receptor
MNLKKLVIWVSVALFFPTLSHLALAGTSRGDWPKSITIAAARVGTGNYALSAGMADLITKYMGIKAVPESSSVGGKTLHLLNKKEIEFAVSFCDQAYNAARGLDEYKSYGKMNIRQMWMGTVAPFAMVTRDDSGVKSIADLKGKTVMCEYPGNLTYGKVRDIFLEAEGMTREDIKDIPSSGVKEQSAALTDKRIVAFLMAFPSEGVPAWLEQLSIEVPVKLFSVSGGRLDPILKKYPFMRKTKLSAKYYSKMTSNQDLIAVSPINSMFCRGDLPETLVYEVMKTVFEHLKELYAFHKDVKEWTDTPLEPAVVPYHPGVIRYWKEKGKWTTELDQHQKQLLVEVGSTK